MFHSIQFKNVILLTGNSLDRSPLRHGFLLIAFALALAWFGLSSTARAVDPPRDGGDGGYANLNTAECDNALFSPTTGGGNMANGNDALFSNTTGNDHTGCRGWPNLY